MADFVLLLYCAFGAKKALMRMSDLGLRIPANVRLFELPCSGRADEVLIMNALEKGYRGVLVVGCQKENCRYIAGNLRAEKRVERIRALIKQAGIREKRIGMVFTAPDEARTLSKKIHDFMDRINET
ncbi:MAG: hydrogenase iron-sulfur subunit [Spirochaetales bacterium]|nr:hydrogenase iron-sulfur subunit [Spirochaetales bacterium]